MRHDPIDVFVHEMREIVGSYGTLDVFRYVYPNDHEARFWHERWKLGDLLPFPVYKYVLTERRRLSPQILMRRNR